MLPLVWIVGAFVVAHVVVKFWDEIRNSVAAWLRRLGLSRSRLMDAWVLLDRVVSGVRCRFIAKTTQAEVKVEESLLSMDEIDDPEVVAQLKRNSEVKRDAMTYVD